MPPVANNTSGIRFPPPVIAAGVFVVGYAIHRFAPLRLAAEPGAFQRLAGWVLVAVSLLLSTAAVFLFRRAGTTPNPTRPTTALVVHGPYRFTRNPMYVGFSLLYLGLALLVNSAWTLVLFPVMIVLLEKWVIVREEAYLEAKFGAAYRAYKARVRRWI
ncbi:MAG TPA: isoprenylcysteine carboxylmethyltransferase family protein [Gemmatimonadales bacterium]|nr:isoprenylcysteine carboxylmethyltransferase family protein [Gemmatimonadales bacterium]